LTTPQHPHSFSLWNTPRTSEMVEGFGKFHLWSWLLQLNASQTCLGAIEATEHRRGVPYQYAARARLDSLWFAPIPESAWHAVEQGYSIVPAGNDFGCINDRFVLAPRHHFQVYAGMYSDLMQGNGVWATERPVIAEKAVMVALDAAGVQRQQIPMAFCLISAVAINVTTGMSATCPICKYGLEGAETLPPSLHALAVQACGTPQDTSAAMGDTAEPPCERPGVREHSSLGAPTACFESL